MTEALPWLAALLAVCGLVAMQATGAVHLAASGTMLSRDVFRRFLKPGATHDSQKLFARLAIPIVAGLALSLATYDQGTLIQLGALALPIAFQLWPTLLGATWFPWITRQGAVYSLGAGILAVILTESIGQTLTGGTLPWGRWPWTIHSAGWGIFFNLSICVIASAMSQDDRTRAHRQKHHDFLHAHAAPMAAGRQGIRLDPDRDLAVFRCRAGRRDRQLSVRRAQRRLRQLGLRHAVALGMAHPVVGSGRRPDLVPGLWIGDVYRTEETGRAIVRRHSRWARRPVASVFRCQDSPTPGAYAEIRPMQA